MQFSLSKKVVCFKEHILILECKKIIKIARQISNYYLSYYFFNFLSKNNQFSKGGNSNIFGKLILSSTSWELSWNINISYTKFFLQMFCAKDVG